MTLLGAVSLYFHTVRHLRLRQIGYRLWRKVPRRPRLATGKIDTRAIRRLLAAMPDRRASYVDDSHVQFLNRTGDIGDRNIWQDQSHPKLWLYLLHYFDDLNSPDGHSRTDWHRALIRRWIQENPAGSGIGWQPYPSSVRIPNWIKWHLKTGGLDAQAVESLFLQARWLASRVEYELLGNHLLENLRALIIAGCFFEGSEADSWRERSMCILREELSEQVLTDGGHYERSPMYQAIVLDGFLDEINFLRAYGFEVPDWLVEPCTRMLQWLGVMCHPDGHISLFNDATLGFAPSLAELTAYAQRLGVPLPAGVNERLHVLSESGFIRAQQGHVVALFDVGPLGPDYLPAHGHADTFTFELSLGPTRVIVDSGTSTYEIGSQREFERSTGAHNTVEIDRYDSSETWASFRVARRAKVSDVVVTQLAEGEVRVSACHDGYKRLRGAPLHRRTFLLGAKFLEIEDEVVSNRGHYVRIPFHLHPDIAVQEMAGGCFELKDSAGRCIATVRGSPLLEARQEESAFHPEFGVSVPSRRILCSGHLASGQRVRTRIEFAT